MTRQSPVLSVLLVDPSLFTAPYDAALTGGLVAAGVEPSWAIRPTRDGDREEIAARYADPFFYRKVDGLTRLSPRLRAVAKGFAHALGLLRLLRRVLQKRPAVVHFQWTVVPPLDALAILLLRRWCPVVLTVHDTTPFNGDRIRGDRARAWQSFVFDLPLRVADRVIVHTRSAKAELARRGVPESKLAVIPHGPLCLPAECLPAECLPAECLPAECLPAECLPADANPRASADANPRASAEANPRASAERADPRWTFVSFGELKRYKGLDLLVEAAALLPEAVKGRARVIIAGRPRMDLEPLVARIAELGLGSTVEIRPRRLSEPEMVDLFSCADCFVFPYRQVDASGVYFLVKSCSKWIIATRVGVFAEDVAEGAQGTLVPPEDPQALSEAMVRAVEERRRPESSSPSTAWDAIGAATRALYEASLGARRPARAAARLPTSPPSGHALRPHQLGRRAFATAVCVAIAAAAVAAGTWLVRSVSAARASRATLVASVAPDTDTVPVSPRGMTKEDGYRLVKNWDFRSLIRDRASLQAEFHTRYVYDGGNLDHLNDEWSRYRDNGNHLLSPQGLALVARARGGDVDSEGRDASPGNAASPGNVESGMLRSRWSGQYGVFEIRMRAPAGRGLWPAFWLNPQDQTWPPEIDVVEIVDNGRDTPMRSFHFLHGAGAKNMTERSSKLNRDHAYEPGIDYSQGYHVFSVEWTPVAVRHMVDGETVVDRDYLWRHDDGRDAGPAHVLVNLAVGGKWPGPPAPESLPASLWIEYIRVWQR